MSQGFTTYIWICDFSCVFVKLYYFAVLCAQSLMHHEHMTEHQHRSPGWIFHHLLAAPQPAPRIMTGKSKIY